LSVLDIGCGGGLVSEPLARIGAWVTGIDPAPENIEAAKAHAEGAGVKVDYQAATAEEIAAAGRTFDAVLLLEVVEHVPDVPAFFKLFAPLAERGGGVCAARRSAGGAWRRHGAVHAEPHAEGLCARHHRG